MKKLTLATLAALLLATGTAHARAERIPPPNLSQCTNCRTTSDYRFYKCMYYYHMRHQQEPRHRYLTNEAVRKYGDNPHTNLSAAYAVARDPQNTSVVTSVIAQARRACGR